MFWRWAERSTAVRSIGVLVGASEYSSKTMVREVPTEASTALAAMADRTMRLNVTIQEGHVLVADASGSVAVDLRELKARWSRLP